MERDLFVHRSPLAEDVLILNRRQPTWSRELSDYIDLGHAVHVNADAFMTITGIAYVPRFPTVLVVEQRVQEAGRIKPRANRRRKKLHRGE